MKRYLPKNLPFVCFVIVVLLAVVAPASGGVPAVNVMVVDASGRVAFKGPLDTSATFATRNLDAGDYVVQFNTQTVAVKGNQYLLVVSAGKTKVIATEVAGETLMRGGAAMKIRVGPGAKITGQLANDQATAQLNGSKYRVIDGKRFVWVTAELGSNRGGHWEEESLAPKRQVIVWSRDELQKRMDRAGEGSMVLTEAQENSGLHSHGY